jgi:hypothetical protein
MTRVATICKIIHLFLYTTFIKFVNKVSIFINHNYFEKWSFKKNGLVVFYLFVQVHNLVKCLCNAFSSFLFSFQYISLHFLGHYKAILYKENIFLFLSSIYLNVCTNARMNCN